VTISGHGIDDPETASGKINQPAGKTEKKRISLGGTPHQGPKEGHKGHPCKKIQVPPGKNKIEEEPGEKGGQ